MSLLAVHISDGILTLPFWFGGFLLAGLLLYWGSRNVQDGEIPRVALVTAAFFIASTIHLKVPPTSVHLLLNGLAGVLLGRRAVLAIAGAHPPGDPHRPWGLLRSGRQYLRDGGPAMLASFGYQMLRRRMRTDRGVVCSALVFTSCCVLIFCSIFSLAMLGILVRGQREWQANLESTWLFTSQPWLLVGATAFALPAAWFERRWQPAPLFALGFFVGSLAVLATSGLNCLMSLAGRERVWPVAPWALVVLHLPVAVLEGLVMGVTLKFLSRVKPEMLGANEEGTPFMAEPVSVSTPPSMSAQARVEV